MFFQPDIALITILLVMALFVSNYQVSTPPGVKKSPSDE